jgi:hypothetical protein
VQRTRITRGTSAGALAVVLWLAGVTVAAQAPPAGKMWLLEEPPVEHVREVYGVELSNEWLAETRRSGLRYGGGTASFVSARGLVLTNHHVVRGDLSRMRHEGKDLGLHGHVARTEADELPIPGASVLQLLHAEDVTQAIFAGVDLSAAFEEVEAALARNRRLVLAEASRARPGLSSELVTLYRGARVHLYSYESYGDVRLVFAPELGAGYFGGETDNFRYPRHTVDFALVRVYADGAPLDTRDSHFTWSDGALAEGDVVFTLGNPGSTDRLLTVAELEYRRDALYPAQTAIQTDFLAALDAYAEEHPEDEARLRELSFGIANGQKSTLGKLQGLRDEARMAARRAVEADLRARLAADAELDALYGSAWEEIELALDELVGAYRRWWYRSPWYGEGQWFRPLARAVALVEDFHPDFVDENRFTVTSTDLVYPFEPEVYAAHLARGRDVLGADDPAIAALLGGKEPLEAVRALLAGTRITTGELVAELRAGGWEAIEACDDPLVVAARVLYPLLVDDQDQKALLESVVRQHAIRVGKATDALEGPLVCPEATFSPRLSAGTVRGYALEGRAFPASTRLAGLFERCAEFGDQGDFDLPDRWLERKELLDLETPLNFVCTVDSTGGSSGSPVFDGERRIVGVLFDGNEESTENVYVFEDRTARAIAVHSRAILETLRNVYEAPQLAAELEGRSD